MSSATPTTVLVLGGTAEARVLAADLAAAGWRVITSLAGRVRHPALPLGEVRVGGFSGADGDGVAGLAGYLVEQRVAAMIDATHPFAATISANAIAASRRTGTPLLRLQRPGWRDHPDATRWTWVDSVQQAVAAAGGSYERPFLTTGRHSLAVFIGRADSPTRRERPADPPPGAKHAREIVPSNPAGPLGWTDRDVTARVVDPPAFALPERWRLVCSRGPYRYLDELALMRAARTDLLVTKDSGGSHTSAKLAAARDLGVDVLMIARPTAAAQDVPQVATVEEALAWLS